MAEMQKVNTEICRTCIYSSTLTSGSHVACNYFLDTGKRRGCKVGECDKYEKGRRTKRDDRFTYGMNHQQTQIDEEINHIVKSANMRKRIDD